MVEDSIYNLTPKQAYYRWHWGESGWQYCSQYITCNWIRSTVTRYYRTKTIIPAPVVNIILQYKPLLMQSMLQPYILAAHKGKPNKKRTRMQFHATSSDGKDSIIHIINSYLGQNWRIIGLFITTSFVIIISDISFFVRFSVPANTVDNDGKDQWWCFNW